MNKPVETASQAIRNTREIQGINLHDLARRMNIGAGRLSQIEADEEPATLDVLVRAAMAMDVEPKLLYAYAADHDPQAARLADHSDLLFEILRRVCRPGG